MGQDIFPNCSKAAVPQGGERACALQAAAKCTATKGCKSFGLSPDAGVEHAYLFDKGVDGLVPNDEWNIWVKDGVH
jgi:hypothetical protein